MEKLGRVELVYAFIRIVVGIVVACLVAGAVQVTFAYPPPELSTTGASDWQLPTMWTLQSATAIGAFAAPFLFLSGMFSESLSLRHLTYHVLIGTLIGVGGFAVLYLNEAPNQPTLANAYALAAYLSSGISGGLAYWIMAGQFAGGSATDRGGSESAGQARVALSGDRNATDRKSTSSDDRGTKVPEPANSEGGPDPVRGAAVA